MPTDVFKRVLARLLTATLLAATAHVGMAASLPSGVAFAGLVEDEWRLFVASADGLKQVVTRSEPRTPAYSQRLDRVAYVAADGSLIEVDVKTGMETTLLVPSARVAYTQPAYRPHTDELYVVALRERSSIETDIGRIDRTSGKLAVVLHQRSAQFEPTFSPDGRRLYYSNVLCASECANIVQEIWSMDLVGGQVQQLTLTNAVARQPAAGASQDIVFSSNSNGHYQLWRARDALTVVQLTREAAVDETPIVVGDSVYFIRRTAQGGRLLHLHQSGQLEHVELNASIKDVRDLRWGQP